MQYSEIKQMTDRDLHLNLKDERAQLQKMEFSHAVSPIENPHKIRTVKKTIARYLTEISRRRNDSQNDQDGTK